MTSKFMIGICSFEYYNSQLHIGQAFVDIIKWPDDTKVNKPELEEHQSVLWFSSKNNTNKVTVTWDLGSKCKIKLGTWYKHHPYDNDWTLTPGSVDIDEQLLHNCKFGKYIGKYMEYLL